MPKYTPTDDEMDGGTYGAAPVSPPKETPAAESPAESVDEQNAGDTEILVGKDQVPSGTKVGDTFTFKVGQDVGDEFILKRVGEDLGETEPTKENLEATTDRELAAIDSQGV